MVVGIHYKDEICFSNGKGKNTLKPLFFSVRLKIERMLGTAKGNAIGKQIFCYRNFTLLEVALYSVFSSLFCEENLI